MRISTGFGGDLPRTEAAQRPPRGRPEAATEAATEATYKNTSKLDFHSLKETVDMNQ